MKSSSTYVDLAERSVTETREPSSRALEQPLSPMSHAMHPGTGGAPRAWATACAMIAACILTTTLSIQACTTADAAAAIAAWALHVLLGGIAMALLLSKRAIVQSAMAGLERIEIPTQASKVKWTWSSIPLHPH